jgi:hypothetical protein
MLNVETRVAEWHSLYGALGAAESRLQQAKAARADAAAAAELEVEVRRPRGARERALQAVDAALADCRARRQHA